jgi:D-alanyl-D-alanine-carboxypeptidase/D-alanyl-D-alanine-endopeptidase
MTKVNAITAAVLSLSMVGCQSSPKPTPTLAEVLRACVERQHRAPGIVVGVISKNGTKVVAYGKRERGNTEEVNGDTIFEIGSITKVFTTLLLQVMVDQGEVKLDDPVRKFLPSSVKIPSRNGKEITLLDLATHTSGLPSLPDNLGSPDLDNPYADYTAERMYDFLSHCKLTRKIGSKYEYSNLGMGLLGHALSLRAGTSYERLIVSRICEPLHMDSTRITLSSDMKSRLATGHSRVGPPVRNWVSPVLQGDGALFSSVNDLLKFLAASMGRSKSALSAAMAKTQVPLRRAGLFMKVGLGWHISTLDTIWHNGETGGYHSYIGFDKSTGVVVLANEANSIDDIGGYVLGEQDRIDRFKAPVQRAVAGIDYHVYDRYVGKYRFGRNDFATISRDGDRLLVQASGVSEFRCELFPASETEFFLTAFDGQFKFIKNETGLVTQLLFYQDGKKQKATRLQ